MPHVQHDYFSSFNQSLFPGVVFSVAVVIAWTPYLQPIITDWMRLLVGLLNT